MCILALVIQHRNCIFSTQHYTAMSLGVPYFYTFSHKQLYFQKKCIEHKMCVLNFSISFVWNICHSKKNTIRYIIHRSSHEVPVTVNCSQTWISDILFKNTQTSNLMTICSVGEELFNEGGWTDMTKLITAFPCSANVLKNIISLFLSWNHIGQRHSSMHS